MFIFGFVINEHTVTEREREREREREKAREHKAASKTERG